MKPLVVALLLALCGQLSIAAVQPDELEGLWSAKQWFGPYVRGALIVQRTGSAWTADLQGRSHPVRATGTELAFDLPDRQGSFKGRLSQDGSRIAAHWLPPNSRVHGFQYATPVLLTADGANRWRGDITPRDDTFTLYLMVKKRPDGKLGAFMRNPERNIGIFYDVDRLEREGASVRLVGRFLWDKDKEQVLLSGTYDRENDLLSVAFPNRGGTYDFRREDEHSNFYPRGRNPGRYVYNAPPARADGWPTASLDEANIDRAAIEKFIQMILDMPMDSMHAPEVQGFLVARQGKLVLEEYFHGEHRDKLHETRSAAKSMTATIVGAVIQAGGPLEMSTPVYKAMYGGAFPADLDAQKRAMTLEHLIMMRSGYFCDDTNPDAAGNEDKMLDQREEGDYYKYTLRLPLDRQPGEKGVYCSIDPNLALGVVNGATRESVLVTFDRLVAGPLQIATYAWPLSPAGQPYGGGGAQFLPRDFMKMGQLMLNGGTWQGRRILSADYAKQASAPLHDLRSIKYGYLWWSIEYPYKDRTVRAYFAGGNGGQVVMVIPDLELVIAAYGGNYADRVGLQIQQAYVPTYILPAVREAGDDKNAPVKQGEFATPYGRPPKPTT